MDTSSFRHSNPPRSRGESNEALAEADLEVEYANVEANRILAGDLETYLIWASHSPKLDKEFKVRLGDVG